MFVGLLEFQSTARVVVEESMYSQMKLSLKR
jgi:hypothetical protein